MLDVIDNRFEAVENEICQQAIIVAKSRKKCRRAGLEKHYNEVG